MSGMTVNRAVSSLRRTQAIFSKDDSAAVSSGVCVRLRLLIADGVHSRTYDLLAKVRIFFNSVRNRILQSN